jgi:Mor family transcriptional regulator
MISCNYNSSRLDNSNGVLHQLDEGTLMSELDMRSDNVLRQEWSSLLGTHIKEKG